MHTANGVEHSYTHPTCRGPAQRCRSRGGLATKVGMPVKDAKRTVVLAQSLAQTLSRDGMKEPNLDYVSQWEEASDINGIMAEDLRSMRCPNQAVRQHTIMYSLRQRYTAFEISVQNFQYVLDIHTVPSTIKGVSPSWLRYFMAHGPLQACR